MTTSRQGAWASTEDAAARHDERSRRCDRRHDVPPATIRTIGDDPDGLAALLAAVASAASLDGLSRVLRSCRDALGIAHLAYQAVPPALEETTGSVLLVTYEDAWVARYFAQEYGDLDPIAASGRRSFLPIDWMDVDKDGRGVAPFFADAERHGVGRHGLTVPVRGPGGRRAIFVVNDRTSEREWLARRTDLLAKVHVLGHYVHARAIELDPGGPSPRRLSRRETQCLRDAARGKLQKVIAFERGLSESAVRLYLSSAKTKLRCGTLSQAVARALALELIGPE